MADVGAGGGGGSRLPHAHLADGLVTACWTFAIQKDGVSALSLQRSLEFGSYQSAWAMLHRLRSVLVRPGRERLQGRVEVDETYIGGEEPGMAGARTKQEGAGQRGRRADRTAGPWPLPHSDLERRLDRLAARFLDRSCAGGRQGDQPYRKGAAEPYTYERVVAPRVSASELLPEVHRIASLAQRWLLGTPIRAPSTRPPGQLPRRVFITPSSGLLTEPGRLDTRD